MYRKLAVLINVFYIKWIKGECRHLCIKCDYRNECWDNLEFKV